MRTFFENGAHPNQSLEFNATVYDTAIESYCFDTNFPLQKEDKATEADRLNEDTWLAYLDRVAIKYHYRRPDYLFLLREFGAKSRKELDEQSTLFGKRSD